MNTFESAKKDVIDKINQREHDVASMAAAFSTAVHDIKSTTVIYSEILVNIRSRISDIKDGDRLERIMNDIITDTRAVLDQSQKLENEICKSSNVIEQMQQDLQNIRREAQTDGLTGLANRKAFDVEIMQALNNSVTNNSPFVLILLDIDYFKTFNDSYGHQIGDKVLRLVAKTLIDGVKGRDIVCRYGGEEFAIILPDTALQAGLTVANNLRQSVSSKGIFGNTSGKKRLPPVTISAGVAEYASGEKISSLIGRADSALYTAKYKGRNQVIAAPPRNKTD